MLHPFILHSLVGQSLTSLSVSISMNNDLNLETAVEKYRSSHLPAFLNSKAITLHYLSLNLDGAFLPDLTPFLKACRNINHLRVILNPRLLEETFKVLNCSLGMLSLVNEGYSEQKMRDAVEVARDALGSGTSSVATLEIVHVLGVGNVDQAENGPQVWKEFVEECRERGTTVKFQEM